MPLENEKIEVAEEKETEMPNVEELLKILLDVNLEQNRQTVHLLMNYMNDIEENFFSVLEELDTVKAALGQEFPQKDELALVRENHSAVMRELKRMQDEPGYVSEWRPKTVYSTNVLQNVQHAQRLFKQA